MAEQKLPTKEELKAKYGIAEDDFEILTSPPDTQQIEQRGFLYRVSDICGVATWLWKSWLGRVLAVIIMIGAFTTMVNTVEMLGRGGHQALVYSQEQFQRFVISRHPPNPDNAPLLVAFPPPEAYPRYTRRGPDGQPIFPYEKPIEVFVQMPPGTLVTGVSAYTGPIT